VDVTVRSANWLERLLPFARPDGTTIVPEHAVVSPGSTFEENHQAALREMRRSERVAAAVALRAAGYDVDAVPRGALVEAVDPDVPAARELRRGDVIVEAAGKPVRTMNELRDAVDTVEPGEAIELRARRGGKTVTATVRTIPAPDEPRRPVIGIRISQAAEIGLPLDVDIDLGDVGGPSAGLPFALDVLQELGRDVDRGLKVAATGEIELDGTIGPIGGMKQKVLGVRRAGADVFVVPAGDNADVARRFAGNLRVIEVETFQQALRKLATLGEK
jgi:PDZ domain-containing protein